MFAKMAKNDILLEEEKRLNNEEFIELLPFLQPYEYFMVEVKLQENWKYLFWYNRSKQSLACAVCGVKLYHNAYLDHAQNDANHLHALKKVEQIYHPVYTFAKHSKKLAQGQKVSPSELRESISSAKAEINKTFELDCTNAQRLVKDLESVEPRDSISRVDKKLISRALNSNITEADQMCIKIGIPLTALQIMEFCTKENEWKPMLTSKDWNEKGIFYCNLCSKYCAGIVTVNAHLNGWQHKSLQIKTNGVRVRSFKHLTKNCCFRYSKQYTVCLKENAKEILKSITNDKIDDKLEVEDDNTEDINIESKTMNSEKYLSPGLAAKAQALLSYAQQASKTIVQKSSIERVEDEGLIGVEYVIKIIKSDEDETPMYECCLCNVGMNELRMQNHLISYNHRLKYCELHYPDTLDKYKTKIGSLKYYDYFRVMGPILAKLAWAIEQHHGRSLPYTIHASKLTKSRADIHSKVSGFLHASQTHGPSFANIIAKQEIEDFVSNKETYKPSIASNNIHRKFITVTSDKIYLNQRHHDPNVREDDRLKKLTKTTKSSTNNIHSTIKRVRSRSPRNQCVTEKRSVSKDKSSEVENLYKKYRGNPECHPLYDKEWDKFWRRRKEELILQGIDHRSYNYQPEWVQFFRGRLEELFEEDIMEEKRVMKQQSEKIHASPAHSIHISSKQSLERDQYHQEKNDEYGQLSVPRKRLRNEESNLSSRWDSLDAQPSSSMQWSQNSNVNSQSQTQSLTDGKANVIHCLRLLVAFEDHLGSLGSKVMDLLSKALVFEKSCRNPRELEEKILNAANCTLLETAMEKLKGILYAGLLDDNKVVGFNRVIHHTSELLQHAEKMGCRNIPHETSEEANKDAQLDRLLNAVHSKRIDLTSSSEKSLSDTLMELMTARKPNSLDNVQNRNSATMNNNASGGSYHSNTPGSNQSFGRINENNETSQYAYAGSSKNQNNNNMGNFNMNRNDNRLSNFNTSLTTDNQMLRSVEGFGMGAGRNNYNNNQYNNYNRSTNYGYQSEYGQSSSSSNINVSSNGKTGYRNTIGNNSNGSGSGGSNWKGYRNNEQW